MQKYEQPSEQKKPVHGVEPDDGLLNGPVTNRGCTDCFCCLLYFIGLGGMIYIVIIGFQRGKPMRLTYPYDPDDRACGQDIGVQQAPYIYMVAPYAGFFNRSVCVKSCPQWPIDEPDSEPHEIECITNHLITNCTKKYAFGPNPEQEYDPNKPENNILKIQGDAFDFDKIMNYSLFIYNTTGLFQRLCVPSGQKYASKLKEVVKLFDLTRYNFLTNSIANRMQQWTSDVQTTWPIILASAGIAFAIGFIYMILMRYCSGLLTWLAIFFYFVLIILLIIFTQRRADQYKILGDQQYRQGVPDSDNSEKQSSLALYALSYTLIVIAALSFVALICYFNRIRLAIAVIKSASIYVTDTPFSLIVPPIFGILLMGFFAFWVVTFLFIYSVGKISGRNDSPFATIEWDPNYKYTLWYHLFIGLWTNALIQAICQFTLASSCCIWYFSKGPGQSIFTFPILVSVKRAIFNHLGSLIFGALLLAIVQLVRVWLEYIHYQMQSVGGGQKQPLKCLVDCCRCYSAYFERFISFLNKNAYIQISLTGKSFIPAAKDGFYLVYSNPAKFAIVNGIGGVFTSIGKFFICAFTTYVCYLMISEAEPYKSRVFSPFLPCLFFFVISYVIGDLFMSVYGMAIDSILQCSIVDETINKKQNKDPICCPKPLKEFYENLKK